MSEQDSGNVPKLPERQAPRGVDYPPEIMDYYTRKFGLSPTDLTTRRFRHLVKSKIDTDVWAVQQAKKIATLEAKIAGLLAFVGKYAKLKPAKVKAKASR